MSGFDHSEGPLEAHQGILSEAPSVWDITTKHGWSPACDATPQGWFFATAHEVEDEASAAANAARIVSAVNACDAAGLTNAALDAGVIGQLVEALKGSLGALEQDYDTGKDYGDSDWEGIAFQRLEAARAALALARGEQGS